MGRPRPLLTRSASNPKTAKAVAGVDIEGVILHLAPADAAIERRSVCAWASPGCIAGCLNKAGRGAMNGTQAARVRRTLMFWNDRAAFLAQLDRELTLLERRAARRGALAVARLNGTSDLPWERLALADGGTLLTRHPRVQFMDYSKSEGRAYDAAYATNLANYHVTFSRSELTPDHVVVGLASHGVNTAVVFDTPKGAALPDSYLGVPVIDGREHDWRFLDPRGVIVGLSALGPARRDTSGFVVRTHGAREVK